MDTAKPRANDTASPTPSQRSPAAIKMDNLIRSKLRISNPYDVRQVSDGLSRLYVAEATSMQLEETGLPSYRAPIVLTPQPENGGTLPAEIDQARDDVSRDFEALLQNPLLKDVYPELRGWRSAIDAIVGDALPAARLALDARQRDRTYAARRQLGDYARIVRYIGALTPSMNLYYRRLAQSLDEVANLLLVIMGDAIAKVGYGGGRFLLQAPASELQERRDAALAALRNLLGSVQQTYGPEEWARGLHGYQAFLERLEQAGHADLRALFDENTLGRMMDELLDRAAGTGSEGLRGLGSTAALAVQQLGRLIRFGQTLVDPQSPPVTAFLLAVQLFYNAFVGSKGGYRLLFISRPPILLYGLYGMAGPDSATQTLMKLVEIRSALAELLDCYLGCDSDDKVNCQIIFDKLLYDLDRSIDYYTLGTEENGEPERRAAVTALIINGLWDLCETGPEKFQKCMTTSVQTLEVPLKEKPEKSGETIEWIAWQLQSIILAMNLERNRDDGGLSALYISQKIPYKFESIVPAPEKLDNGKPVFKTERDEAIYDTMLQELCAQADAENNWLNLLGAMAPSCRSIESAKNMIKDLQTAAYRQFAEGKESDSISCAELRVNIPPPPAISDAAHKFGWGTRGRGI